MLHTKIFCQKFEVIFSPTLFNQKMTRWDRDLLDKGDLAKKAETHTCHKYQDMSQETTKIENLSSGKGPEV